MFIVIIPAVVYILFNNKKISVFIYDIRYTAALSAYIAFIFILVTAISNGRTLGKALVNIQIVSSANKGKAGILRLAARYIILWGCLQLHMHIIYTVIYRLRGYIKVNGNIMLL